MPRFLLAEGALATPGHVLTAGLCNMMGLAGGAVSQIFNGSFADYMKGLGFQGRAQWDPAFYLYGGVLMAGGLLWVFINPRRTVVAEDAEHV